jgi:MoaA/NifB/PqqE/SkfB family radical SAM enzyme
MKLRNGKWKVFEVEKTEPLLINNEAFNIRSGLTFTPFANPTKCNAHCRFCSEELQRKHQKELTALNVINDYDKYFEALASVLKDLSQIDNIGLSLSGLEATSDPIWLLRFLDAISIRNKIPNFDEKVLYTNSTGLYKHPDLVYALKEAKFDRLEISRCHYDDTVNQKIMYINRNEPVHQNEAYEKMIHHVQQHLHIKNSCILTQIGVNSVLEVEYYLDWIMSLGVKEVVFRELSRLDDNYIENKAKIWAEENRVPIDHILDGIMKDLVD